MTIAADASHDPRLDVLFCALDDAEVAWCLLRPSETLRNRAGDVDVLVDPARLDAARQAAVRSGFGVLPRGGSDVHAIQYDPAADDLLWVHVQAQVDGAGRAATEAILGSAVRDPWPRPPDAWMYWILLLHVLDKGAIAERHRQPLRRLAATDGADGCPLASVAAGRGIDTEAALRLARAGEWDRLMACAASRRPPLRLMIRRRLGRLREAFADDRPRGMTVAVIGPDGAGKTTLVESLRRTLPVPTRTVYMGLTAGLLPLADALRLPGLVFAARAVILAGRYARGRWHRARGRIAIFERYALDGHVPSGIELSGLSRASRWVQARIVPAPDLVLLLDASGKTMFRRSNEYDAGRLEDWRQAYRRLQGRLDALVVLDAEQPREVVHRRATAHILSRYADLWARP
jgi:thymidylate kinase